MNGSKTKKRLLLVDTLRGLALVNMLFYHALWDLIYLAGITPGWYSEDWAFLWQQGICCSFILLSGFCWPLGRQHLRRGGTVLGCGLLVTAVTLLAEPEQPVWFGVLSLLGCAALLLTALEPLLRRLPAAAGLALSVLAFVLTRWVEYRRFGLPGLFTLRPPEWLYQGLPTAILGFHNDSFYSSDYFPLIPWFFLFLMGYFVFRLDEGSWERTPLMERQLSALSWLGQRTLPIYLLHQPLLYGLIVLNPLF